MCPSYVLCQRSACAHHTPLMSGRFKLAERRRSLRWQVVTGAEIVTRVEAEGTQLTKWITATIGRARMIQIELGIQPLCCRLEDAAGRHGQQKCI